MQLHLSFANATLIIFDSPDQFEYLIFLIEKPFDFSFSTISILLFWSSLYDTKLS